MRKIKTKLDIYAVRRSEYPEYSFFLKHKDLVDYLNASGFDTPKLANLMRIMGCPEWINKNWSQIISIIKEYFGL